MLNDNKSVVVVGAGLAGLSCAYELAAKGYSVKVVEAKSYLGGRTSSWNDSGMQVESGLHRFLGFYEHLPNLLEKCDVSVDSVVTWLNEFEIILPEGRPAAAFAISPSDDPLQMLKDALGQTDFLPVKEKLDFTKLLIKGLADYATNPQELDRLTATDYAKKNKISDLLIERILTPFTEGIFFLPPSKFSAFALLSIIGPYVPKIHKLGEGAFRGGMSEVMIEPIIRKLKDMNVEIITNSPVTKLLVDEGNHVHGILTGNLAHTSAHTVLATELGAAKNILRNSFDELTVFKDLFNLDTHAAVTVQLELEAPALPSDIVRFSPGTILASYAEQSRTTFKKSRGRLSVILSDPEKYITMQERDILNDVIKDAHRVGLNLDNILDYRVITHPHDFYKLVPGSENLRPMQETKINGLTLAGDYTKQKYIATMEGAIYSGILAAQCIEKE